MRAENTSHIQMETQNSRTSVSTESNHDKKFREVLTHKEKRTAKALATVGRAARAFNPSADESRLQTVMSNAIKTSNLAETTPQNEVVSQSEPTEEHKPSLASQANIEALKQYLALDIKLIPVYDNGDFISTGNPRDWRTDDISEIQDLISGRGYRDGLGRGIKIKIFRFFPIDYGLVVIDIDKHTDKSDKLGKNGPTNWLKIEAELNLPQNCKIMKHTCCVLTPSSGFHLYYKTEGIVEFKKELTTAADIPKAVTVAGSVKAGKEYRLIGSLNTIPTLPDELKELMLKPTRIEQQLTKRASISHSFSNGNEYLSSKEMDTYKTLLSEYLVAKGFQVNASGLTNCPFPEHHNNGDKIPSAHIYPAHLWCYKNQKKYDIWAIAERLNGDDFRAAVADVINTLERR
jgi:hypothetical protein